MEGVAFSPMDRSEWEGWGCEEEDVVRERVEGV